MSSLGSVIHAFEQKFSAVGIYEFPPPGSREGSYIHREVGGAGDSFDDAVKDFEKFLPDVPADHNLIWRVFPEVVTEFDHDRQVRICKIYGRCVITPRAG